LSGICTVVWTWRGSPYLPDCWYCHLRPRRRIEGNGSLGQLRASALKYYAGSCFLLAAGYLSSTPPQRETSRSPHDRLDSVRDCPTLRVGVPSARCRSSITTRPSIRSAACTKRCSACNATASQSLPMSARIAGLPRRHPPAKNGANCAQCHTVQGWNIAVQQVKDHQNRFPLLGAHAAVQCEDCHKSAAVGQYQGLSTACSSCHMRDFSKPRARPRGRSIPANLRFVPLV